MIEVPTYLNLKSIINRAGSVFHEGDDVIREANFMLEAFALQNGLDADALKNAIIKKMSVDVNKDLSNNIVTKRIERYYLLQVQKEITILKEIITKKKKGLVTFEENKAIKVLEQNDLIEEGIYTETGEINYDNSKAKKLGLRQNKRK